VGNVNLVSLKGTVPFRPTLWSQVTATLEEKTWGNLSQVTMEIEEMDRNF
jgi:hypothetical protein